MVLFKPKYWMQLAIPVLVSLAATQMLFSQVLSRVGIFIPKSGAVQVIFSWLVKTGDLAGTLVMVLAIVPAIYLVTRFAGRRTVNPLLPLSLLLLLALVVWIGLSGGQLTNGQFMVLNGLTLVITSAVGVIASKRIADWREFLWFAALAGIVSCSLIAGFLTAIGQNLGSLIWISYGNIMNNIGQVLLAISGFIIFCAYSVNLGVVQVAPGARKIGIALLVVSGFMGVYLVDRYTIATLLQWSVGLNMVFPVWVYALSLGCFIIGLSSLANRRELGSFRAWGTLLVVLAGYQMPFTSDLLLVALGLALLAFPELVQEMVDKPQVFPRYRSLKY